jgi:hypothetical protein
LKWNLKEKEGDLAVRMCQDVRTSGFFCPSFLDASVCARRTLVSSLSEVVWAAAVPIGEAGYAHGA